MNAYQILNQAKREGWAVGAFNAANFETLKAIVQAAQKLESPVIIESSSGETDYFGAREMRAVVDALQADFNIPIILNLDHATDPDSIDLAIAAGYDLIHFDGGKLPYQKNLEMTKKIVNQAHAVDLLVESEIDHIEGSSNIHQEKSVQVQKLGHYTNPQEAQEFVRATNIDTLAVFIGNVHGIYADAPKLDFDRLAEIRRSVDCFLSLHGGSGIRDQDIKKAVKLGISKVNVNSELRAAFLESLQKAVKKPKEIAAYKFMPPVIEAVQKVVEAKIKIFGSAGKAKKGWIKRQIV